MDVTVNVLELACGVAVAEIGRPAPQHVVQVGDHDRPWCASEAAVGSVTDLGPYRYHRPFRRPALQIPMTGPSERLHLVVVVSPGSPGALLRRGPLRTGRARFPGI